MADHDFSFSKEQLQDLVSQMIQHAQALGASACEASASEAYGQSVSVRKGEVETLEYNRDKGLDITVYFGQQSGYASSSDFSEDALRATVEAALSIARFTAADPAAGLADKALMAQTSPDLSLFHPWHLSVEDAVSMAQAAEAAAFETDERIVNSEGASISTHHGHFVMGNSAGFMGGFASTRHGIGCAVIAEENDGMQRDDWSSSERAAEDLLSPELIGQRAAARAVARLNARKIATCEVPVIFEAPLAAGLIGSFVHAASGGALYRKSSFLLDSLGQRIFSEHINISERPHLLKGLASTPFDDDGVATRDREVVQAGVLQGYFLSSYTARKLGMQSTGNSGGAHNLIVQPGAYDLQGLLKQMGRGLLVTELLGQGINYVTGDYSRGAAGFWIENGEIAHAVEEVTIAGNLKDMFRQILAVGNDVYVRGGKRVGSIWIENMTVAGH